MGGVIATVGLPALPFPMQARNDAMALLITKAETYDNLPALVHAISFAPGWNDSNHMVRGRAR